MTRRDRIEIAGLVLLVGGAAILSPPWALIILGSLILLASVAGRAIKCFRQ